MGFLDALASQLSSQFSLGEVSSSNKSFDIQDENGDLIKYGALGPFAQSFDASSQRSYVEEGYLRTDPYRALPKQFEILMQQPNATVLLKKRMFSSIAENFRPDYMDADEKLYLRCIKILFQNKCNQIATLEKLSKIQKVSSVLGQIDNYMIPIIISLSDTLMTSDPDETIWGGEAKSFAKATDRLRRLHALNIASRHTSWITDSNNLYKSQYAEGSGVIEITNFTNLSTDVGVSSDRQSSCNFMIADPYQSMLITDYDIEKAISDATNNFYKRKGFLTAKEDTSLLINELQNKLNTARSNRGVSNITFNINPDTLFGRRITAIIDTVGIDIPFNYDSTSTAAILSGGAFGGGVSVTDDYLINGKIAGINGLDNKAAANEFGVNYVKPESELSLFQRLVTAIYSRLSLDANSKNSIQTANQKTNYVRRKLRFNFLGKLIIQPMDTVHVYISSGSKFDNKLLGGLNSAFSGYNVLQSLGESFTDLKNAWENAFNPAGSVVTQVEKSVFVGSDFPDKLWSTVRGQFLAEKEGTHVFAGIVQGATDSWKNDGSFHVNVQCRDNTYYLEMGPVNFNPGVDVWNGSVFDPLTPFKSKFDQITSNAKNDTPELLEENKVLLTESGQTALTKHKAGRSLGQPLTSKNIIQDRYQDPLTGSLSRIFYAPNGLVNKWKEGIGVLVQFGNSSDLNGPERTGSPNIYKDAFAGQDIMNTISLLITGTPYNFATYWKSSRDFNFKGDSQNNESAAKTFYESITASLTKNNTLWGNFIPFKTLSMDESTYMQAIKGQFDILTQNDILNNTLQKIQQNQLDLYKYNVIKSSNIPNDAVDPAQSPRLQQLTKQSETLMTSANDLISKLIQQDKDNYIMVGDDITYDSTNDTDSFTGSDSGKDKPLSKVEYRKMMRRQINFLTRRMSYNVRANEDKNLFIVDDFYDKDYDIMAYNKSLGGAISLFNNAFISVKEKVGTVAGMLNLEVFCDTQGHIRVRPPQYNRIPSSVFYRMMQLKKFSKVQLFPQFIDDLFKDQLSTIKEQIELVEAYIRLDCAFLGKNTDVEVIQFLLTNTKTSGGEQFKLISNEKNGRIVDIDEIMKNANPDPSVSQNITAYDSIRNQATSKKDVFRVTDRASFLLEALSKKSLKDSGFGINDVRNSSRISGLLDNIFSMSGQRIKIENYLTVNQLSEVGSVSFNNQSFIVDYFKAAEELSTKIAERQKAVKLFYNLMKNAVEYKSIDDESSPMSNQLVTPSNFGNTHVPEVFEHMIEDESYDDYGPGSANRFVIKRSQIISMDFRENPPSFNAVKVSGTFHDYSDPTGGDLPPGFNSMATFGGGTVGHAMVSAMAVDYDMWRNYGLIHSKDINLAFLRDPNSQCAPFATMMLSKARKEVLTGNITIAGNEYMQPGEVVYIEDRGLLFYVDSVKHTFTFNNSFRTTLGLTYGHAPGEYIPTTLDVIGKMIFNNRDLNNIIIQRQMNSFNEKPLGIIQYDGFNNNLNKNNFAVANIATLNNILYGVQQYINDNSSSKNKTKVELRIYYDDNSQVDPALQDFANVVKDMIKSGQIAPNGGASKIPYLIDESSLIISTVNQSKEGDPRSPSQKAWSAARDMINSLSSSDGSQMGSDQSSDGTSNENNTDDKVKIKKQRSKVQSALYKYVIDCWLIIKS